jgi:ADP-heptose:LPS heptosyltransferase
MPEGSPSVLIIRLDGVGDALALTPLLAALRRHAVPVDVVLRPANAGIFTAHAARRIIVARFDLRSTTRSNLLAIQRLGADLRSGQYTHALVATEDPAGYRIAARVGAPVRVGFADFWGKPFKALWSRRLLTRTVYRSAGLDRRAPHECDVLYQLAKPLVGNDPPSRDVAELRPLVIEREPSSDERIAIQITDKWQRLGIALEHVVELVRRIGAVGVPHLLSSASESAYAIRVAEATGTAISFFNELEPWKAAIRAAPAVVTPDSGALHVAGMLGTPVVGIFPVGRGYDLQVARWAPWAAPHRIVRGDEGWPVRATDALSQLLAI